MVPRRLLLAPLLSLLVALLSVTVPLASAQTETILYDFGFHDGDVAFPYYGLALDGKGRFFGTSHYGGPRGVGGVFELTRNQGGRWKEQVIHGFLGGNVDGSSPYTEVVVNEKGDVYGTTSAGGRGRCRYGCGTVFQLKQKSPTEWAWSIIWDFPNQNGPYGVAPTGLLLRGKSDVYGMTGNRGQYDFGTYYRLVRQADGRWKHSELFDFSPGTAIYPLSPLVPDSQGKLYGISAGGGDFALGTVFQLTSSPGGHWVEQVVYSFQREGGAGYLPTPNANLAMDNQGNLYATTVYGGYIDAYNCSIGCGTVIKVSYVPGGTWVGQILYEFQGDSDGAWPVDGVVVDDDGNVYGTTQYGGGAGSCAAGTNVLYCGTVFKLTPQPDGSYVETILHSFSDKPDGAQPYARPVLDGAGNLYGTTSFGGTGQGTVYQISLSLSQLGQPR